MLRNNKGESCPRLTSVMVSILLVLICLGGAGSALASDAQGKTRAIQNGVITKIEAQTHDGSGPQGDTNGTSFACMRNSPFRTEQSTPEIPRR